MAACGNRFCFLMCVARLFGQSSRRRSRVPITGLTEVAHPTSRGDAKHKLDKHAQHRCQPELRKRWDYQPVCARLCLCHGHDHNPRKIPGRICAAPSPNLSG